MPGTCAVALVIADGDLPGPTGIDLLVDLHGKPDHAAARKVLLTDRAATADVFDALRPRRACTARCPSRGRWTSCAGCIRALLTSFVLHHAPDEAGRLADLIDTDLFPRAFSEATRTRREVDSQMHALQRSFPRNLDMTDEEVEEAVVAAVDVALDNPPRRQYPAGAILLRRVKTSTPSRSYRRLRSSLPAGANGSGGSAAHPHGRAHRGAAVARAPPAGVLTCRAATDITVIPLTLEQLDKALQANPWLSVHFVTALIRSLGTRSRRMTQLKVEVEHLNRKLRHERDQLADALARLEQAQCRLVENGEAQHARAARGGHRPRTE